MNSKVEFTENFTAIVNNCIENGSHLGGGNPNSKILVVGKEAALNEVEAWYEGNAKDWYNQMDNQNLNFIRTEKFPVGHTWSKYQKLHDYIFPEHAPEAYINFEERFFTTEMNDNPAKKNSEAKKRKDFKFNLQNRKDTFFKENFIQDFPVTILACSDYIKNTGKIREIDTMFDVTYPGDEKGKHADYSRGNSFYLHYNEDQSKLVIHTRQLSNNVDDKMLQDMGIIIREHLNRNKHITK
ncbi:hypothetical protein [Flavobacterium subsaxonicum]|uniref:Uncharacterized protein n=1 Tax=Flavobacterium subsaxonicum WB 4.1-42 = DSM 21790 TaxID=1121898 RepID=A0A0A2MLA6_9FLAO|nr:hypothetical protein [Flavobacterium subsaxonicum]KGO92233.1 hypothetical protein Q766_13830 [Flavobacterium subsaxonicum WB 4.1-42 = DSM 21790]